MGQRWTGVARCSLQGFALVSIAVLLGAGCGAGGGSSQGTSGGPAGAGGGDGTASVTGILGNAPVAASLSGAVIRPGEGFSVVLTNVGDVCTSIVNSGGEFPKGSTVILFGVSIPAGQMGLPPPGSYPIDTGGTRPYQASAEYIVFDASSCTVAGTAALNESIGTITVASISDTEVSGSFDIKFSAGTAPDGGLLLDHTTGQFSATGCALGSALNDPTKCAGFAIH
jgi:hypothetical protein